MKSRIAFVLILFAAQAAPLVAQSAPGPSLPPSPPVEKELAAHASDVTEVTLDKNMLAFASKFMNGKHDRDAEAQQLIQGLDGIYVRDYEFQKEGDYTPEQVEQLRQYFETSAWTPVVRDREKNSRESTDVMVKLVNGESHGMLILSIEPKEISLVLILGPIRMDQLGALKGLGGMGALGNLANGDQPKIKDKAKDKREGDQ